MKIKINSNTTLCKVVLDHLISLGYELVGNCTYDHYKIHRYIVVGENGVHIMSASIIGTSDEVQIADIYNIPKYRTNKELKLEVNDDRVASITLVEENVQLRLDGELYILQRVDLLNTVTSILDIRVDKLIIEDFYLGCCKITRNQARQLQIFLN